MRPRAAALLKIATKGINHGLAAIEMLAHLAAWSKAITWPPKKSEAVVVARFGAVRGTMAWAAKLSTGTMKTWSTRKQGKMTNNGSEAFG